MHRITPQRSLSPIMSDKNTGFEERLARIAQKQGQPEALMAGAAQPEDLKPALPQKRQGINPLWLMGPMLIVVMGVTGAIGFMLIAS